MQIQRRLKLCALLSSCLLFSFPALTSAQGTNYPTRPITFVVPNAAGGAAAVAAAGSAWGAAESDKAWLPCCMAGWAAADTATHSVVKVVSPVSAFTAVAVAAAAAAALSVAAAERSDD